MYTKAIAVLTQSAIYELMLADEAAIANKGVRRNKVAAFLNDGIRIQDEQYMSITRATAWD
jgi:hypothetical protein